MRGGGGGGAFTYTVHVHIVSRSAIHVGQAIHPLNRGKGCGCGSIFMSPGDNDGF